MSRSELSHASAFAIWTAPPSSEEFQAAVHTVKPEQILLFALDPEPGDLEGFLQKLVGYLKFSIKKHEGRISISHLAEACAQREATIWSALRWMESKGSIHLDWGGEGDEVVIQVEKNDPKGDLAQQTGVLRELWKETQSYRLYFQRADANKLSEIIS
jgi:hypothetical protein